jgi:hypothetical protein
MDYFNNGDNASHSDKNTLMRKLVFLFFGFCLLATTPVFAQYAMATRSVAPATCPKGTQWGDGCLNAVSGTVQVTNYFTGYFGSTYTARPPYNVVGADYATGVEAGVTLVDPATASGDGIHMPAACSFTNNSTSAYSELTCSTGANLFFTGIEFGPIGTHACTEINFTHQITGTFTMTNNHFIANHNYDPGCNGHPWANLDNGHGGTANIDIEHNTCDDQGQVWNTDRGGCFAMDTSGTRIYKYNALLHAACRWFETDRALASNPGDVTFSNNFEDDGSTEFPTSCGGNHFEGYAIVGHSGTGPLVNIYHDFNNINVTQPQGSNANIAGLLSPFFQLGDTESVTNTYIRGNVLVATRGGGSNFLLQHNFQQSIGAYPASGSVLIDFNYIDDTGNVFANPWNCSTSPDLYNPVNQGNGTWPITATSGSGTGSVVTLGFSAVTTAIPVGATVIISGDSHTPAQVVTSSTTQITYNSPQTTGLNGSTITVTSFAAAPVVTRNIRMTTGASVNNQPGGVNGNGDCAQY